MAQYLSVTQYALKHQKDVGNIRRLLLSNRLPGIKIGNQWAIDSSAPYPDDKRISLGKYVNYRKTLALKKNKVLIGELTKMFEELSLIYGKDITAITIYGSYARGEQKEDSDIDIALFVKKIKKDNTDKMLECVAKYELDVGKVLSVIEIDNKKYNKWKKILPFYKNINKEGITLWKKN